jgi:hypothetical protein
VAVERLSLRRRPRSHYDRSKKSLTAARHTATQ